MDAPDLAFACENFAAENAELRYQIRSLELQRDRDRELLSCALDGWAYVWRRLDAAEQRLRQVMGITSWH